MREGAAPGPAASGLAPALFTLAVFSSAALVFLVEPMIAQMLLPRLGGSPAVWNTSLAFFQIALLAGYGYAHLLQRVRDVRRQMAVHLGLLVLAALTLPLRVATAGGPSSSAHPILWLLGALALSIGAPFAVLSATAPLLQAWFARIGGSRMSPYVLYAASNLGSLLALLSYPALVQPLLGLRVQALGWSLGYGLFAALVGVLAWAARRVDPGMLVAERAQGEPARPGLAVWRERALWTLLAAAPSSLLLGVTLHITTDVASAPFLWIPPLALYLLTFVIAFQDPPPIPARIVLVLQAIAAAACLAVIPIRTRDWLPLLGVHLACLFLTALMCHQALTQRRPHPARLTEFYLCMSLGGVIGGAFNAFLAPVIFDSVWEYPLVLVLAGLARPWGQGPLGWQRWIVLSFGLACTLIVATPQEMAAPLQIALFAGAGAAAFVLRNRAPAFTAVLAMLAVGAQVAEARYNVLESRRSFFGVLQIGEYHSRELGPIRFLVHGSTLHGAQVESQDLRCTPLTYYAPEDPIGQVYRAMQARRPSLSFGTVGMGTASVAGFVRAGDRMQFFEIDPLVVSIAGDPDLFSYWHGCARGPVGVTLGDARLSLERAPGDAFDLLLVDAFSSDAVPVHLMTVEAMRTYLRVIRPDGVIVLHLSNRNLDLTGTAAAAVKAAGGSSLLQEYVPPPGTPVMSEASSIVLIAVRTPQALAVFAHDPRWTAPPTGDRPWTDDYSNVLGALIDKLRRPH
jgi:hypothetical protein